LRWIGVNVRKLREALEPQVATISQIPPFDVALGYEIYSQLLKPVESGWKGAKSLIVATNGALVHGKREGLDSSSNRQVDQDARRIVHGSSLSREEGFCRAGGVIPGGPRNGGFVKVCQTNERHL